MCIKEAEVKRRKKVDSGGPVLSERKSLIHLQVESVMLSRENSQHSKDDGTECSAEVHNQDLCSTVLRDGGSEQRGVLSLEDILDTLLPWME